MGTLGCSSRPLRYTPTAPIQPVAFAVCFLQQGSLFRVWRLGPLVSILAQNAC